MVFVRPLGFDGPVRLTLMTSQVIPLLRNAADPTRTLRLASGDAVVLGGAARLAFHGVDRIIPGSSTLLAEGGRINLTLRRVTLA